VVEKERKKDLGKVVTGGGEGTGKTDHRARKKQTTEDTEDTEKSKPRRTRRENKPRRTRSTQRTRRGKRRGRLEVERAGVRGGWRWGTPVQGADTLVRPCRAWHWVEQRAVGKGAQGRLESRPQARKPAPHRTRHGGHGEKANHGGGHGGHGDRKRGGGHAGRPLHGGGGRGGARSHAGHAASLGGGWRWNSRTARDCVALPA
jgi:hypothetical protein